MKSLFRNILWKAKVNIAMVYADIRMRVLFAKIRFYMWYFHTFDCVTVVVVGGLLLSVLAAAAVAGCSVYGVYCLFY